MIVHDARLVRTHELSSRSLLRGSVVALQQATESLPLTCTQIAIASRRACSDHFVRESRVRAFEVVVRSELIDGASRKLNCIGATYRDEWLVRSTLKSSERMASSIEATAGSRPGSS